MNSGSKKADSSRTTRTDLPTLIRTTGQELAVVLDEIKLLKARMELISMYTGAEELMAAMPRIMADLRNLESEVKSARPHAICCYCNGHGCQACSNRGWLSEAKWKVVPVEMRK